MSIYGQYVEDLQKSHRVTASLYKGGLELEEKKDQGMERREPELPVINAYLNSIWPDK